MQVNRWAMAGLAAVLPAPLAAAPPAGPPAIGRFVDAEMAANHIPALAYAVVRDGRVVAEGAKGFGNVEWRAPLTVHSRFQLASVTKLFTGLLVMRMVEAGRLDLDRPVSAYLSDAPRSWAATTVRHLATHTSGIPETPDAPPPADLDALYRTLAAMPLDWAPGSRARYGFNDFAMLRLVMERTGGKPLPALLSDYVIRPLGLTDTAYPGTIADGQTRRGDVLPQRVPVYARHGAVLATYDFLYPPLAYAAGGLTSSIADLAKVMAAIEQRGFLKERSIDQLVTSARLADGRPGGFGIGWIARTHQGVAVAGHSGGPALADVLYFRDRRTAVVVLQNQHDVFPWLAGGLADLVVPPPPAKAVPDSMPAVTERTMAALRAAPSGKVDPAGWSASAQSDFLPWLTGDGAVLVHSLGAPLDATLVGEARDEGGLERTYSIRFTRARMRWTATVNADGTLEALIPTSG